MSYKVCYPKCGVAAGGLHSVPRETAVRLKDNDNDHDNDEGRRPSGGRPDGRFARGPQAARPGAEPAHIRRPPPFGLRPMEARGCSSGSFCHSAPQRRADFRFRCSATTGSFIKQSYAVSIDNQLKLTRCRKFDFGGQP